VVRHLEPDPSGEPVDHPALDDFFDTFDAGRYVARRSLN
jgi:heat shock protein HspQ